MKKALLFLFTCLLSIGMNAQTFAVEKSSTNKLTAQKSQKATYVQKSDRSYVKALEDGQYLCGLYTTDDLAEYGSGLGSYTSGVCKAATIFDNTITANYDGFKVVGMRVGLCYAVSDFEPFISKIVGGQITPFKSKALGKGGAGWTTVMFDESEQFTLSSNDNYMVGFSYYQRNDKDPKNPQYLTDECYPISYYEGSEIKGTFYFYGNIPSSVGGSGLGWYSVGNSGALSVQLIVKGELSDQHIILSNLTTDKNYYQKEDKINWSIDVTNMGKDPIENLGFNIYIDNILTNTVTTSTSIAQTKKVTVSNTLQMPSDIKLLGHTLKIELTTINGESLTGDVDNNNSTAQFIVYSQTVARQKHLIEHFTSNTCTYCPLGYTLMRQMVAQHDDVAWVSIHGNMNGKDPLNFTECDQIQNMEKLTGWPGASFNRIYDAEMADGDETLVYGIGYYEQYIPQVVPALYEFMKTSSSPSFVTLEIEQNYDAKKRNLDITINGKGVEGASLLLADHAVTIYLTEDGLTGRQLNNGKWDNNYEHNNALRMVVTNVGGDPIKWNGDNFTVSKSVTLPEEYIAENMTITAFVAPYVKNTNNANIRNMAVNNCEQAAIITSSEENTKLYADSVELRTGNTGNISLNLDNDVPIIMAEFWLQLPEGVTIATDEEGYLDATLNADRSDRHSIEVERNSDGLYHFLIYHSRNKAIKGNSGQLINVNVVCDNNMAAGTYEGVIRNILLNDSTKKEIFPSDYSFIINVTDVQMGDVNGDHKINGSDIVELVDRIMGRPSDKFVEAAADINGDGSINGSDLTLEIELVMSQDMPSAPKREAFLSEELAISDRHDGTMSVSVNDGRNFILAQMVVELSPNQKLEDITTDNLHQVAYKRLSGNRFFVVCYSTSNAPFSSNDDIITIHHSGEGDISITNTMLVDEDRTESLFGTVYAGDATGITGIGNNKAQTYDILSLEGVLVRKQATSLEGLQKGVYLINGKKITIK